LIFRRARPVYNHNFSNLLYGLRPRRFADDCKEIGACRAVVAERADLDQLVTFEVCVHFADHLGRNAGVPDDHYGFEMVSSCAQSATLAGSQFRHVLLADMDVLREDGAHEL
jgi:hypothetical protein